MLHFILAYTKKTKIWAEEEKKDLTKVYLHSAQHFSPHSTFVYTKLRLSKTKVAKHINLPCVGNEDAGQEFRSPQTHIQETDYWWCSSQSIAPAEHPGKELCIT